MTKKKELSEAKAKQQIDLMLPTDMKSGALAALDACQPVRKLLPIHLYLFHYTLSLMNSREKLQGPLRTMVLPGQVPVRFQSIGFHLPMRASIKMYK